MYQIKLFDSSLKDIVRISKKYHCKLMNYLDINRRATLVRMYIRTSIVIGRQLKNSKILEYTTTYAVFLLRISLLSFYTGICSAI